MKIKDIDGFKTRMLEERFKKGNRDYEFVEDRVYRGKVWHLYKVTMDRGKYYEHTYYELFRQKFTKKNRFDKSTEYEKIEAIPSDESFGFWAFAFLKIEHLDRYANRYGEP